MNQFARKVGEGWRSARWQQYFIVAFLPAALLISLLTRTDYQAAPNALTISLLVVAALFSLLWAGSKEGNRSPLAKPTLILLSVFALILLLCKITFSPKDRVSVAIPFGEKKVEIVAQKIQVAPEESRKVSANPLAAYDFIRFA